MALCFHGDKRETLGWSASLDFREHTPLCNREQSNSVQLSTNVGLTCGCVRENVCMKDRNEERGEDRGDRQTEWQLQREMSLPTGCSYWNSGHVTYHRRRGCLFSLQLQKQPAAHSAKCPLMAPSVRPHVTLIYKAALQLFINGRLREQSFCVKSYSATMQHLED